MFDLGVRVSVSKCIARGGNAGPKFTLGKSDLIATAVVTRHVRDFTLRICKLDSTRLSRFEYLWSLFSFRKRLILFFGWFN